jgi:ATP-dependent Zn protease
MKPSDKALLGFNYFRLVLLRSIFWIGVLTLAVIVLKLTVLRPTPPRELPYDNLVQQIDQGNITRVRFLKSAEGTKIIGELRNPAGSFRTQASDDQIESMTARLSSKGISAVTVQENGPNSPAFWGVWIFVALTFLGFFLILNFQIARVKRRILTLKNGEAR